MTSKFIDVDFDPKEVIDYVLRDPRGRSAVFGVGDEPVLFGERLLSLGGGGVSPKPSPPFLYDHDWPWIISELW